MTDKMARIYGTSPLDILSREAEDVIRLLNYLTEKGEEKREDHKKEEKRTDDIMKKVTSKTATGGWW